MHTLYEKMEEPSQKNELLLQTDQPNQENQKMNIFLIENYNKNNNPIKNALTKERQIIDNNNKLTITFFYNRCIVILLSLLFVTLFMIHYISYQFEDIILESFCCVLLIIFIFVYIKVYNKLVIIKDKSKKKI